MWFPEMLPHLMFYPPDFMPGDRSGHGLVSDTGLPLTKRRWELMNRARRHGL